MPWGCFARSISCRRYVAALVSQKFMPDFQKWLDKLSSLGYVSRWTRLNAKNYGVPQNRDRVFCLSMRRDVAFDYQFPEPFELLTRLEDVLEEEVSDRYFLKDDAVSKFLKANDSDNALFLQFDLPPTHEAAMFLKTYFQIEMERMDLWDKDVKACEKYLRTIPATMMYEQFFILARMDGRSLLGWFRRNVQGEYGEEE